MKKYLLTLLACGLLAACNGNQNATQNEGTEAATTEETAASDTTYQKNRPQLRKTKRILPHQIQLRSPQIHLHHTIT